MTDKHNAFLKHAQRQWEGSSIVLQNQINDLQEMENQCTGKWKSILTNHIDFLINFNNYGCDFITQSMHLHRHQQFQLHAANDIIQSYATNDVEIFKKMISTLKK